MNNKGFTLIELVFTMIWIMVVGISIYGLVLCFKASIILGIIALVIEPTPLIVGLCAIFGKDIANAIQNWIHFPV